MVYTPFFRPPVKPEPCHILDHDWHFYDGLLGYESSICSKCGWDWNDVPPPTPTTR